MFDLNEQLAIYKFDLIHRCLSAKDKDLNYWEELREKMIMLNNLIKRTKDNAQINCTAEIEDIKKFILKTK